MMSTSINMCSLYMGLLFCVLIASVESFSWQNCGESNDPIQISSLSVTQNASMLMQLKGSGRLTIDLKPPLKVALDVKKKMFWGWMKVPCVDNMGSCNFDDACALTPYKDTCPKEFSDQGLPCNCPIARGSYAGALGLNLNSMNLPKWLETGSYRVTAKLSSATQLLLCLQFEMKIK